MNKFLDKHLDTIIVFTCFWCGYFYVVAMALEIREWRKVYGKLGPEWLAIEEVGTT